MDFRDEGYRVLEDFSHLLTFYQNAQVRYQEQLSLTALENEHERFQLWMNTSSKFSEKLSETSSGDISHLIDSLLLELGQCIDSVGEILTGKRLPLEESQIIHDLSEASRLFLQRRMVDSDSSDGSSDRLSADGETFELSLLLNEMIDIIDRLYKLYGKLRRIEGEEEKILDERADWRYGSWTHLQSDINPSDEASSEYAYSSGLTKATSFTSDTSFGTRDLRGNNLETSISSDNDRRKAWDLAQNYPLMDLEDIETIDPVLKEQLAAAIKERLPPAEDTNLSSSLPTEQNTPLSPTAHKEGVQSILGLHHTSIPYLEKTNDDGVKKDDIYSHDGYLRPQGLSTRSKAACNSSNDTTTAIMSECENLDDQICNGDYHFCWACSCTFCDSCWDKQIVHKTSRTMAGGTLHEKTNISIARKVQQVLEHELTYYETAKLHVQDEETTWFGVARDEQGQYFLADYGRYAALMAQKSTQGGKTAYPSVISFIGETGGGKSTLIRLLIELISTSQSRVPVPVVGATASTFPTSGDVHLYYDPQSFGGDFPLLYADCEGLQGGEKVPLGAKSRLKDRTQIRSASPKSSHNPKTERQWKRGTSNERTSREFLVRHLYPRLLYIFSDVLVFVLRNSRLMENSIVQLIEWAIAALETSSNQPMLPHAIIVLNATSHSMDQAQWDTNVATSMFMEYLRDAVIHSPILKMAVKFWADRGRQVEDTEALLLCYYSSIRVVRIPQTGRPMLISEQLHSLYNEISRASGHSRLSKQKLRMLLNSDNFEAYVHYALDHFSRSLDTPFDFLQANKTPNSSISSNFGNGILNLAINVMNFWGSWRRASVQKSSMSGSMIFEGLSIVVASCIMLDSVRHRNLGVAEEIFSEYVSHCDKALEVFCKSHWPCEYENSLGRCLNVEVGHIKGHQFKDGMIFAAGGYVSGFTAAEFAGHFRSHVYTHLTKLFSRLSQETKEFTELESGKAAQIHKNLVIVPFYQSFGDGRSSGAIKFMSHATCFSCLANTPELCLRCGHVLCTTCALEFSFTRTKNGVIMRSCPLHDTSPDGKFQVPQILQIKPHAAGTRILSLDGGGVRGILQLILLQRIEKALGPGLPIQSFFDLVVGTSSGGIIALGLAEKGWSLQKCTRYFEEFCRSAYRERIGAPILANFISSVFWDSRYKTASIEATLKTSFGEQKLFGEKEHDISGGRDIKKSPKVAVTTTSTAGKPMLLANYSREDGWQDHEYQFLRPEKPSDELKIWEAARATSATPTYWRPYIHHKSGHTFQDGGLFYQNPIEIAMVERNLIWPKSTGSHPDVVLSMGTGFKTSNTEIEEPFSTVQLQQRLGLSSKLIEYFGDRLNSERAWRNFLIKNVPPTNLRDRYVRLNVKSQKNLPAIDDIRAISELKELAQQEFGDELIQSLADRLLATSFYFELDEKKSGVENADRSTVIRGRIMCRFEDGSEETRAFGRALRRRFYRSLPFFAFSERRGQCMQTVTLSEGVLREMIMDGIFSMKPITIAPSNVHAETEMDFCLEDPPGLKFPISGSPRCLVEEATIPRPRRYFTSDLESEKPPNLTLQRGLKSFSPEREVGRQLEPNELE